MAMCRLFHFHLKLKSVKNKINFYFFKKEDVEWFSFENKIAFDLETLLITINN